MACDNIIVSNYVACGMAMKVGVRASDFQESLGPHKMRLLLLAFAFIATFSSSALAGGAPRAGQALAERWCASCHLVTQEQTQASADIPSFRSIAKRSQRLDWLEEFLADSHPPMPTLSLTRQDIQNLEAYLESLKQN